MEKVRFGDLDVGERFKYNLMYWEKIQPRTQSVSDNRSISVNSRGLSDDHYESEKTDVLAGVPNSFISDSAEVEPFTGETRRERVINNR